VCSNEASSSIFKVFGMTQPGMEPGPPIPLANTLTIAIEVSSPNAETQQSIYFFANNRMFSFKRALNFCISKCTLVNVCLNLYIAILDYFHHKFRLFSFVCRVATGPGKSLKVLESISALETLMEICINRQKKFNSRKRFKGLKF
jgi:hypothetical protein